MSAPPPSPDALAELLGPPIAQLVRDGQAAVAPLPVPGLPEGSCWTVNVPHEPHLPAVVVGHGPGDSLRLLSDRPDAFAAVAAHVGASIGDADTAIGYVRGFLTATRPPEILVQVPFTADEIDWRPGSPEEEARRRDFIADTELQPQVEQGGHGFEVSIVLLRDQHAVRITVDVGPDGRLDIDERTIAEDLPLPIVM